MQPLLSAGKRTCAAGLLLLSAACATTPEPLMTIPPLAGQPAYEVQDVDFLAVSEPMSQFVEKYASQDMAVNKRAWSLSYSMLDRFVLPFDYDASLTFTAEETFRKHSGNCLSFSAMLVAMARSAGLTAWFQEVEIPPTWTNVDETFLVSKHVNAVVESWGSHYVVDVSGTTRNQWLETKLISDEEAFAQYYNNLGADALVVHDLPRAYAYFRKALELAPWASYIWSNIAVVFNRNDQREDAKSAYRTALSINPHELTALNNLHQLYSDEGLIAEAGEIQSRVDRYRSKNPWYMYRLSMEAVDEKRYQDAVDHLEEAIELNEKEYRFHYALARVWLLEGNNEAARNSLERAKRLAPAESEVNRADLSRLILNVDG